MTDSIKQRAEQRLGSRVPSHKPYVDGTDVKGLVEPVIDAIGELEAEKNALTTRIDQLTTQAAELTARLDAMEDF